MESHYEISFESESLKIKVSGILDVQNANNLIDDLKKYSTKTIHRIVFYFNELEYISSSGLRVLIYSKQKLNPESDIYLIHPNDMVLDVLAMTGLNDYFIIQETF